MRRYRKWVLTLGLMAVSPGIAMAGPLDYLKGRQSADAAGDSRASQPANIKQQNQKVAEEVAARLRAANLSGYDIDIKFQDGAVTLTGKIEDLRQKAMATSVVSTIPEIKRVENNLTLLKPAPAKAAQAPNASKRSDLQTAQHLQLAGAPAQQHAVQQTTFETTAPKSNQQMAEEIASALSAAGLSGYDIEIRYQNGLATLGGSVSSMSQRIQAENVVALVNGVTTVNNKLTIAAPAAPAASTAAVAQAGYPAQAAGYPAGPGAVAAAGYRAAAPGMQGAMASAGYGYQAPVNTAAVMNNPNFPNYAWPTYADYPNYAAVTYPQQYSASAWPYIGPFYPYPQVPLGWRQVALQWDDGYWSLNFRPRTERWWWFLHPKNW